MKASQWVFPMLLQRGDLFLIGFISWQVGIFPTVFWVTLVFVNVAMIAVSLHVFLFAFSFIMLKLCCTYASPCVFLRHPSHIMGLTAFSVFDSAAFG